MTRGSALRALWIGIACVLVLVALGIYVTSRTELTAPAGFTGTPVTPPKFATDFVLTDQDGKPAHLFDANAAVTFLFFGYTHCPDECPLALAALGRAYRSLAPQQANLVRIVFVSVDPERDVPAVMKRYDDAFDPHIVGLTGTHAVLVPVWNAYGVAVDPTTKELEHGDAIYAIDRSQHVALIYPSNVKASDLAADAKAFAAR